MRQPLILPVLLGLLGLFVLPPSGPVRADDEDHDRARDAVLAQRARPLAEILGRIAATMPGKVLDAELETEDGRALYELKILTPDGRLVELSVDAATGAILEREEE
ncbi:peptidase [Microvirga tunisiensis]|uniref:Peptidase n=1 Tax=Pannonibacter tanglangensis TaxID=2750084 RepID=A0A7X5J9I5_9HYPH|nr:PepSY domain-containing protein [Pannonibacter sp. XCT-53]NBN78511.1 peptidase [Pannonibacter sp. XCT-53]